MTTTEVSGSNSSTRLPGWLDEITASWLTEALRSTSTIDAGTSVSESSWELLGDGEGFIGDLALVSISYEGGDGPASAVVKVPTRRPENRGFGMIARQYENEVRFYSELHDRAGVRTPTPYFVEIEANPRSSVIAERVLDILPERVTLWLLDRLVTAAGKSDRRALVMMEYLGDARIGDQVGGASREDAEHAIDLIARFHANFWKSRDLDREWLVRQGETPLVTHGLFERAWPVFEAKFRDQIDAEVGAVLNAIRQRGPALLRRMAQGPLTLLHGDFRMDNVAFFDGEDPPAGMIDFQAITVGHPLADIAYFIRPNLDPDLADEIERDLLRRYHEGVVAHGVTDYPFETLEREYELAQLWLLHTGVILLGTLDLGEGRGALLIERAIERALRVAHRLRPDAWF